MNEKYIKVELFMDFLDRNARDDLLTPADIGTALEMIPAEDVKPVVHAHVVWAKTNISYQTQCCSNCHRTFISRPDETIQFCPHCGANMDEEEGNDTGTER